MSLRYCYSTESMQGKGRKAVDDECSSCIRIRYSSDQRRNPVNASFSSHTTRLHGRLFTSSSPSSLLFCQDSSFKAIYFGMLFCFLVILIPPATCALGESSLSPFKCLIQLILYFINQRDVHFLASTALINQSLTICLWLLKWREPESPFNWTIWWFVNESFECLRNKNPLFVRSCQRSGQWRRKKCLTNKTSTVHLSRKVVHLKDVDGCIDSSSFSWFLRQGREKQENEGSHEPLMKALSSVLLFPVSFLFRVHLIFFEINISVHHNLLLFPLLSFPCVCLTELIYMILSFHPMFPSILHHQRFCILMLLLVILCCYFALPGPESLCSVQVLVMEIRGGRRKGNNMSQFLSFMSLCLSSFFMFLDMKCMSLRFHRTCIILPSLILERTVRPSYSCLHFFVSDTASCLFSCLMDIHI